ncbi:MAG: type II toxin-antitoxin system PemK/MazF family toxin [Pseudomonadota bacterium]
MAITIHPKPGQILLCDFSVGFRKPEMVKSNRPVIVLSPANQGRANLVTVVALSTSRPEPVLDYHLELPKTVMPMIGNLQKDSSWVKGDMVYAIGFHRLNLIRLGGRDAQTGKRKYFKNRLSRERMREVYGCVLCGLGLTDLKEHL